MNRIDVLRAAVATGDDQVAAEVAAALLRLPSEDGDGDVSAWCEAHGWTAPDEYTIRTPGGATADVVGAGEAARAGYVRGWVAAAAVAAHTYGDPESAEGIVRTAESEGLLSADDAAEVLAVALG